jgi:MraZ protein
MPETVSSAPNSYEFHGNFRHGLDESRRIMLPAKWRPQNPNLVFRAILWPIAVEQFLLVLPPERWQLMLEKLQTGTSLQDKRVASLERVIAATSAVLPLDKVGRLCLPENLVKGAALEREVEFVGRLNKFEIWNPARYQAITPEDKTVAASIADQVNL